ncbi:MAG: GNAT family N-acetyltransferase [Bullifex sp.]|nr:GNAT family N-acetyltransferase [Spirochaetales bacterium]MDY2816679.1 GNAT family N-acetyltransferase [Bullifex sp.]
MFRRLSSFTVDYTRESHLIIPFSTPDENTRVYVSEKGIFYILAYGHLFVIADSFDSEINVFIREHRREITHALFPRAVRTDRFLLKRKNTPPEGGRYTLLSHDDISQITSFYTEETPFDTDEEYLSSLSPENTEFSVMKDLDGRILSSLYTIKGRQCAVAVATREAERGRGHASRLINSLPFSYLFTEDESLIPFYEKLGFSIAREYQEERYSYEIRNVHGR